ncbi:MAG: hypothetical protein KC553_04470 [Nitrospina sp.]|nr:hypothetical protein [Nitrospina sp.]
MKGEHNRLDAIRAVPSRWRGFRLCREVRLTLQNGEVLKRGCGRRGLYPFDGGWRCFYCGRYLYESVPSLQAMWFHFRLAREYWRVQSANGRDFINGVPVPGLPDPVPQALQSDLSEPDPPEWFSVFVESEEAEFKRYLKQKYLH